MPTKLDDHLIADALGGLTEWSGDSSGIRRTVDVTGDVDTLLAEVQEAADTLDHHPDVDRDGRKVTFTLSTHSEGGVTELDIALASRIDDFILKATGEGLPVGGEGVDSAPTPAEAPEDEGAERDAATLRAGTADSFEPLVGTASGGQGTMTGGVTAPDDVPDEPEPGIATPRGQGAPPAGQEGDA